MSEEEEEEEGEVGMFLLEEVRRSVCGGLPTGGGASESEIKSMTSLGEMLLVDMVCG